MYRLPRVAWVFGIALPLTLASAQAHAAPVQGQLGSVKFIRHGLHVQPPGSADRNGTLKMPLFQRYRLRTGAADQASIGFRDGTVLHMNSHTDAQLTSPTMTRVSSGEVDEVLVPGTSHSVQTNAAVASAIGTNFMVRIVGPGSYFMVVHGAVLVSNQFGSVVVKHNQGSLVIPGQPPQPAYPVDAGTATTWVDSMPTPKLPENIALDASGGSITGFSSQYVAASSSDYGPFPFGLAANLIDGRLDVGWESNTGLPANQWVKIGFQNGATYLITAVQIDPAATQGDPSASDMKQFEILVSTTGTDDADFHTVLRGTCMQQNALQRFSVPPGTHARYLELLAVDNYGDPKRVAVSELEVISPAV
jgi:hypothetical protein